MIASAFTATRGRTRVIYARSSGHYGAPTFWRTRMTIQAARTAAAVALLMLCLAGAAVAQAPPAAPAAADATVVANPTYTFIPLEIAVNKPAAEVWKRVGKFCAIGEWFQIANCTITQGKEDEWGSVRSVANEVLVGKTE